MKDKKSKKPTVKTLLKHCDELWSLCVRTRRKTCCMCGSEYRTSAHHIRSRTNAATRYDLENGLTLCWKCHSLQKFSPEKFQDRVIEVIGAEEYERLKQKSLVPWKLTLPMLEDIKLDLTTGLKHLRKDWGN